MMGEPLATLYYTWDELEVLADLVDGEIATVEKFIADGHDDGSWPMLNSLRTSLREAQFTVGR